MSNHRRLLLSPLLLLVALTTVLTAGTVSASAAHGSETRVRAIATVTADAVGQPSSETPGSVGCLRPPRPAIVSGSCVATNTADDLAMAESHLGSLPDGMTPPNRMMLDRIAAAQESGRALTVGEQNCLLHETTEAELVSQGLSQDAAHAAALETHPLFMNYDPEVIKAYPEYFNSNWRKAWGLP